MTLFLQLRSSASAIRKVSVDSGQNVTVEELIAQPPFPVALTETTSSFDPTTPPREQSPDHLRWAIGFRGPPSPLSIGDRVVVDGQVYELLFEPRPVKVGRTV